MLSHAQPLYDKKSHIIDALQRHPVHLAHGTHQHATLTLTSHHEEHLWCWDIGVQCGPCPLRIFLPDIALDPTWHNGLSLLWDKADPVIQSAFIADQAHHIINACSHQLGLSIDITHAHHIDANKIAHNTAHAPADMFSLHGVWTIDNGNAIPLRLHIPHTHDKTFITIIERFKPATKTIHHPFSIEARLLYGIITIDSIEQIQPWQKGDIVFFDISPRMHQPVLCLGTTPYITTRKDSEHHLWLDTLQPPTHTQENQDAYRLECHSSPFPVCLSALTGTNPHHKPIPIPPQKQSLTLSLNNHAIATGYPTIISTKRGLRLNDAPEAKQQWTQQLQNETR